MVPRLATTETLISRLQPGAETDGNRETARRMAELVCRQPGFLGMESWRDADGRGVTISWWDSEEVIAGSCGRDEWYESWRIRVCRVEREERGP